jgi:cellulose biosynthesis protein BcsQ
MSDVGHVVAILNQKGGVGKTTVTLGLASAARAAGRRVLVVDLDPQAASTWILGLDPLLLMASVADVIESKKAEAVVHASAWGEGIDVLPSSSALQANESGKPTRLRRALAPLVDQYDVVLVDCPPSLGNLTLNALTAARQALIVVEPATLGLRGIGGVADAIDQVWDAHNPHLELAGVIVNRVPGISSEAARRSDELVRIVGRSAVWEPVVPQRVIVSQAMAERRPIHAYGSRARDVIDAFDELWQRLAVVLGLGIDGVGIDGHQA